MAIIDLLIEKWNKWLWPVFWRHVDADRPYAVASRVTTKSSKPGWNFPRPNHSRFIGEFVARRQRSAPGRRTTA